VQFPSSGRCGLQHHVEVRRSNDTLLSQLKARRSCHVIRDSILGFVETHDHHCARWRVPVADTAIGKHLFYKAKFLKNAFQLAEGYSSSR
jgi:hypothetical protein